ncbi:hypothetical protein ZOSMA_375G00250 [Zostera marina]|uniref:Uncharacterized protein n=1 Tax=Zostera marina TaxID=29655 RepID=A0A0K9P5N6_ZOSMR|nr:hypothetical protein ZOSMA_375G00250 [Zostera marina]
MNLNLLKNKFSQTIRELTEEQQPKSQEDEQGGKLIYEEVSIVELKKKVDEAQREASSCREKENMAAETTRLYKTQVADVISEVGKLKKEIDRRSLENDSLMKTIEDLKSKNEDLEVKSISGPQDRQLFEETSKANLLLRESTIKATTEAVSLKAELKSSKEKQAYLERAIEKFQEKLEGRADELNEMNEMCASYQRQADAANMKAGLLKSKLEESHAARCSLARVIEQIKEAGKVQVVEEEQEQEGVVGNLRHELELNKAKVAELEDMFASTKSDKEETTNRLLELTQKLKQKKYLESEKMNDLQNLLDQVTEERDNFSRTLDCTRKIVEDQRKELARGLQRLQSQRDMVNKKELERQKSMKLYESVKDGKEEAMDIMEKHIKSLEKELEISTVEKKTKAVNGICTAADDQQQQVTDLQEKIKQLEQKLLLATEPNDKEAEEQKKEDSDHACQKKDGIKKKTRQIVGNWRTKSFRYARESTKCVCCLINGKQSMGQKFAIRIGFFAIFVGLVLLGRRIMG